MVVYTLFLVTWSFLFIEITGLEVCYEGLGCFPIGKPWFSLKRIVLPPQGPDKVKVNFQLFTRQNDLVPYLINGESNCNLSGSHFDNKKLTYMGVHGFTGTPENQLKGWAEALLSNEDANVFLVDYSSIKNDPYVRAVSNGRVVGALMARFIKYLVEIEGTPLYNLHLIGTSMGAHVAAYAAKRVPGIGRLTGLDPSQPLFEGESPEVRIDKNDALFVDVLHTNGRPTFPLVGLGLMAPVGHVDFYFNGGWDQPGCRFTEVKRDMSGAGNYHLTGVFSSVLCSHGRSKAIFMEAYTNRNCTFWSVKQKKPALWGVMTPRWQGQHYASLSNCTLDTCSPVGPRTQDFPARGSFDIITSNSTPLCYEQEVVDASMRKQLQNLT